MSKKIDENRDEDLENKDDEAAEDEDTDSESDDEENEDEKKDDEDESDDEEEDDEDKKDDEDEEDSDEDEEDDDEGDDKKGKFTMPDKFKGKSAEEIAKAYQNLEGMVGQKAQELAQSILTKKGIKVKKEDGGDADEFDIGLTDEQIAKMSPKEFARHLNQKITEKATDIAKNAIERSNEVKTNVSREIKEATKAHPHLKDNKGYREIVLSIIEAANAKGKVVTLKEACEKADKAMNIKPGDRKEDENEDGEKKKKPKTAVEKQDGSDGGKMKTDEDRVKEGMMNAGNSGSFLGGLGI